MFGLEMVAGSSGVRPGVWAVSGMTGLGCRLTFSRKLVLEERRSQDSLCPFLGCSVGTSERKHSACRCTVESSCLHPKPKQTIMTFGSFRK